MQDTLCAEEIKFGRRQLLVGASLAGAIATLPKAARAETETPVMRLFREWEAAQAAEDLAHTGSRSEEEADALGDERRGIEERLMATPAQDAKDVICKVLAASAYGVFYLPDCSEPEGLFWSEAKAVLA